ncbi:FHA domain-containing protein [Entamoeba marina]
MGKYNCYDICIKKILFKNQSSGDYNIRWRSGWFPWNKGKCIAKGNSFRNEFNMKEFHFRILAKQKINVHFRIRGKNKGQIIISDGPNGVGWKTKGGIDKVEGILTKTHWGGIERIESQPNSPLPLIQPLPEQSKMQSTNESVIEKKTEMEKIDKRRINPDQVLLKELIIRDAHPIIEMQTLTKMEFNIENERNSIESMLDESNLTEIVNVLLEKSQTLPYEEFIELLKKLIVVMNILNSLVGKLNDMTFDEIVVIGQIVLETDGIVSLVETVITNHYKDITHYMLNTFFTSISKSTDTFKENGVIDDEFVNEIKNMLLKIHQELLLHNNETCYLTLMRTFQKKLEKKVQTFDIWDSLVLKYMLDSLSSWIQLNSIQFKTSTLKQLLNTKFTSPTPS